MKSVIRPSLALLLITTAVALVATSCNTLRGVGRDISATGNGVQKAVN